MGVTALDSHMKGAKHTACSTARQRQPPIGPFCAPRISSVTETALCRGFSPECFESSPESFRFHTGFSGAGVLLATNNEVLFVYTLVYWECQPSLCLTLTESPLKGDDNQEDRSFADSSLFNHWGQDLGPESRRVALKMFQYYGYNGYLSDRLSMDRPIPDYRPDGCKNMSYPSNLPQVSIVFIFVNEALSVILRSIHSAMNRTPHHLLKEIILVDDNSNNDELKEKLQDFVKETNAKQPGFIKVVRHSKQEGLIRSRVSGWRAASAPVVALFDAHVEFNTGWLVI
ncbi:Polypeptide N-acetylgalactosaminyltransferase 18 [Anabarilius grahami]|uniref:Polypeptide N-acetylgalactosaminyltransferase 18 n=1 Tax=Anabarilius grahami TaxID=495550 RepID=A0A3N0Y518_ANAGA|nr:Polypeptide N-acetylgalactosaminyltransferase 18 [Anabarilius grahami]